MIVFLLQFIFHYNIQIYFFQSCFMLLNFLLIVQILIILSNCFINIFRGRLEFFNKNLYLLKIFDNFLEIVLIIELIFLLYLLLQH